MSVARRERKRKIILPGSTREAGSLILPGGAKQGLRTLMVPRGYEGEPPVIVGKCHVCDATFYRGSEDEWQRHVGECARSHLGEIMDARAEEKQRMAIFQPDAWDPEFREHMDKVGARMKREGRLVQRPNER